MPDPDRTIKAYQDFEKWVKNDGNYNFYQYAATLDDSSSIIALDNIDDTEDLAYRVTITKMDESTGVEQEQLTYLFNNIDSMGLTNPDPATIAIVTSNAHESLSQTVNRLQKLYSVVSTQRFYP